MATVRLVLRMIVAISHAAIVPTVAMPANSSSRTNRAWAIRPSRCWVSAVNVASISWYWTSMWPVMVLK